jgi:hypothetical protein
MYQTSSTMGQASPATAAEIISAIRTKQTSALAQTLTRAAMRESNSGSLPACRSSSKTTSTRTTCRHLPAHWRWRTRGLVAFDAVSPSEAVARIAQPLWGMKNGRLTFKRARPELLPPKNASPTAE